jgi:hypothetical protein
MPDQLVAHNRPAAAQHPLPTRVAQRRAQRRVGSQPGHRGGQGRRITRGDLEPGDAVLDEVERSARSGRDHGQAACGGLLQGLAEGIVRPAVHEHVKAGVDPGEIRTATLAEQHRLGHCPPHRSSAGPLPTSTRRTPDGFAT